MCMCMLMEAVNTYVHVCSQSGVTYVVAYCRDEGKSYRAVNESKEAFICSEPPIKRTPLIGTWVFGRCKEVCLIQGLHL